MTHLCIRRVLIGMALTCVSGPATGQTVVYDPSNYAQNVLQAARALQQINNQVTSLQNQTQMLLNQVKNLTSLPYSALQSIVRTQQLLNQAQRIAYDINQIDQEFGRSYPQSYPVTTSSQQLTGDAQTRWQNALAGYQDALRVQAGVVQGLETSSSQTNGLLSSSQSAAGPGLRQIQPIRHWQARIMIGKRQCHRNLAIRLLAKLTAVLVRNSYRVLSLLGIARVVDDPGLDRSVTLDLRQHHLTHLAQHNVVGPAPCTNKMQ